MTESVRITVDEFENLYKPIANHLDLNASFDSGDGDGTLFETYGEELAFVKSRPPNTIWTLLDSDCGVIIVSGWRFVNRIGYFITEIAVPNNVDIHVVLIDDLNTDES